MLRYTKALCRKIPRSIVNNGLRMEAEKEPVDYEAAVRSKDSYVKTLESLGIQVTDLETDESFPDCVFVEDTAVIVDEKILLTNPGAQSRKGEIKTMKEYFNKFHKEKEIFEMKEPAVLDGGDVLFTGHEFFVGLTTRTNMVGVEALRNFFNEYPVHSVSVTAGLHLKSFLSMLCENMIVCGCSEPASATLKEMLEKATIKYSILRVPEDRAANVLYINGSIVCLTRDEMPESFKEFEKLAHNKIYLSNKELHKVDGAFTCRSLLFN